MPSAQDDTTDSAPRTAPVRDLVVGRSGTAVEDSFPRWVVDRLTSVGERTGDVLVYSSAYLAVIAMAQVAVAMVLLSLPSSPAPAVVGLVTFAVYANDRIADVDTDAISNPRQSAFVRRNQGVLYLLASVAYGVAVTLSVLGGPLTLGITLLPGLFWILYASNWIPDVGLDVRRLKDLLFVNSTVVALGWATTVTFLPLAFAGAPVTPSALVVFAYFFLGTFVNSEIPNVPDVRADRAIGVSTMPSVFGVTWTRRALVVLELATAVLLGVAFLDGLLSLPVLLALVVGLAYKLGLTAFVGRTDHETLLTIAAEAEFVVVFAALAPVIYGL